VHADFALPAQHPRTEHLGPQADRRRAHGRLQRVSNDVQAAAGDQHRGVLQPRALVLEGDARDVLFLPTYLRYFKKHPRLRVFTATMAAAGFGNFFYHFFAYDRHVYNKGIWQALISYHCYAIYALILGTAIGISQIRILGKKKAPLTGSRKVRAIAGVLLFYCLLTIFDAEIRRDLNITQYVSFFLSLFIRNRSITARTSTCSDTPLQSRDVRRSCE
jgi:hypothetical protein